MLRADASRFHRRFDGWGRFGVSAFVAADDAEVSALCRTRLERFAMVVIYHRNDLQAAWVEIAATFRTPHVTLAHQDLAELVAALLTCEHGMLGNPHYA